MTPQKILKYRIFKQANRDALGERSVAITRRLTEAAALGLAGRIQIVFDKELERLIDEITRREKITSREVFSITAFREELQLAFEGMENLMFEGFRHGDAVLNLFGETETVIPPSSSFFRSATRAITAFAIEGIAEQTADKLRRTIVSGSSAQEIVNELRQVTDFSASRARMIARTEASHILHTGQEIAWQESGVVEEKEWFTAGDERVCPWCISMQARVVSIGDRFFNQGDTLTAGGNTLDIYEDILGPPIHPNCRCDLLPV